MSTEYRDSEALRVAVIADSGQAAAGIARALADSSHTICAVPIGIRSACDRVRVLMPSAVLLRASPLAFPLVCSFARATAHGGPALVVLTPTGSQQSMKLALDSGALVHLVEPVPAQMLLAAIEMAVARARNLRRLRAELSKVRETVHSRGTVERAKGILMRRLRLTEEEAHRRLQQESRNRNRKLAETAWHVIEADATLAAQEKKLTAEAQRCGGTLSTASA